MYCTKCGNQVSEGIQFCPQCGTQVGKVTASGSEDLRHRVTPRAKLIIKAVIVVVLLLGLGFFLRELTRTDHPVIGKQPVVSKPIDYTQARIKMTDISSRIENGNITFSLDEVRKYRLVRIHYEGRTSITPVLAYISGEGKLVTAISRSEPDNAQTFSIEGTFIKCGNCPANWQLNNMKANACCPRFFPDPIPSSVAGNEIRIEEAIVANWTARQ